MTMEIVKNNKGGSKLCFEGYTYTKKSVSKTTIQWECSQRKAYVCKGKVTTDSQVARVIRTIEHSHDANLERVEATKIIASIKESAGTRRATPAQLYADHTQYATAHIRAEIGHQDAVKRTIRSVQRPPGPDGTIPPIRVRKTPPLFPPDLWNVNIQTMSGASWKHVVNHLRSECEKSPNNYRTDSSICARHTIMTIKHLYKH